LPPTRTAIPFPTSRVELSRCSSAASGANDTSSLRPASFRTYPSHPLLRSHSPPYVASNACKSGILGTRRPRGLAAPRAELGPARLTPPDVPEQPAAAGIAPYKRLGPSAVGTRPVAAFGGSFARRLQRLSRTHDSRPDANGAGRSRRWNPVALERRFGVHWARLGLMPLSVIPREFGSSVCRRRVQRSAPQRSALYAGTNSRATPRLLATTMPNSHVAGAGRARRCADSDGCTQATPPWWTRPAVRASRDGRARCWADRECSRESDLATAFEVVRNPVPMPEPRASPRLQSSVRGSRYLDLPRSSYIS
jgi:hypothetical protein